MPRYCKSAGFLAGLLAAGLVLSSCTNSGIPLNENGPALTLPPATISYAPPIGDAALEYTAEMALYLPAHDGSRLISFTDEVLFSVGRPQAENLTRALLNHPGNGTASPLGGSVKLSLYGVNPVEVSRDVVTVNLSASALQLDRKTYYLACQAITNTLTGLPGIHYVNFLVMDRQIGLGIAGIFPMGSFSRSVGSDIGGAYDLLFAQSSGAGSADKRLSTMVTLYFPIVGMEGFLPEVRSVSFESLDPASMILRLLSELSAGPQQMTTSPALPLLADLLTDPPSLRESPDGGGQLVSLNFTHNLDDMLEAFGLNRANCLASICYTLTTFMPNLAGITVTIGGEIVQNVKVEQDAQKPAILFQDMMQRRSDYSAFVLDVCALYFASESEQELIRVERAVPYYSTTHPRALLLELAKGPLPTDFQTATRSLMPLGAIVDSDLLGFSLNEDTLLVNFSQSFESLGIEMSGQQERLLAYGIVNTVTPLARIRRVSFFVSGALPNDFSGEIFWAGDFYPNMGLVQNRAR